MDLGLVCPRCARLSPLRATQCSHCQSVLWRERAATGERAQAGRIAVGMGDSGVEEIPELEAEHLSELASGLVSEQGAAEEPANSVQADTSSPGSTLGSGSGSSTSGSGPGSTSGSGPEEGPPDLPRFGTDAGSTTGPIRAESGASPGSGAGNAGDKEGQRAARSETTLHLGPVDSAQACPRVVLIRGGAQDGVAYELGKGEHTLGRSGGDIHFENDEFLSTPHARFVSEDGQLAVEDLDSINGVFVRIRSATPLMHDDCFLVGEQLLRVDTRPVPQFAPNERGTYFYGSPRPKGPFRIVQCLAGGGLGRCQSATGSSMSIGREAADFNFPRDRFISGHHARVEQELHGDRLMLHDLRSRNGTFLRIRGRYVLRNGDYLFIGQQLFRIELQASGS